MGRSGAEGRGRHPEDDLTDRALPAGVTGLDHTADIGIRVEARSLASLFDRAALGMLAILTGDAGTDDGSAVRVQAEERLDLEAPDVEALLVRWLREILFLFQVRHFAYRAAVLETLEPGRLVGRVEGVQAPAAPVTELKGVTYHGLEVVEEDGAWHATVIFDV